MPVIEYAFLSREADNASVDAQELYDQAMGLIVQTRGDSSFFEPELLSLPKETLTSLQQQEDLSDYNVYLANLIRQKDHTLSKDQELLLSSMSEILSGSNHIYSTFTNVDLHFPDMHMPDGSTTASFASLQIQISVNRHLSTFFQPMRNTELPLQPSTRQTSRRM